MAVKLIVGLGNPGPKYQWTRHNAGFMVLDRLSRVAGIPITRKAFSGLSGDGAWGGERVYLLSTGAYTQSYSSIYFNGFPPLKAYILK